LKNENNDEKEEKEENTINPDLNVDKEAKANESEQLNETKDPTAGNKGKEDEDKSIVLSKIEVVQYDQMSVNQMNNLIRQN